MAKTLLSVAETVPAARSREARKVRKAYEAIQRFLPKATLTEDEEAAVRESLAEIKAGIEALERNPLGGRCGRAPLQQEFERP